jgi:hypothetical protein
MIVGLTSSLPENLLHGLTAHGVPHSVAEQAAHLSPVSTLFAAFLGYDPVQHLIGAHVLAGLPAAQQHELTGRSFFPGLISAPFRAGLHAALDFAIVASLLAAGASWLRGGRYVYSEPGDTEVEAPTPTPVGAGDDPTRAAVPPAQGGERGHRPGTPPRTPAPALLDASPTGPTGGGAP